VILLLGGTSETAALAEALAADGARVLVSCATDVPLAVGDHPRIARRTGRLDAEQMAALVAELGIGIIVDALHPYAAEAHTVARTVSARCNCRYARYGRPAAVAEADPGVTFAAGHDEAAELAAGHHRPILLTIGSKFTAPYVAAARRDGLPLRARVLDNAASVAAGRAAGLEDDELILGRGPFSVEENLRDLRALRAGVLVTKDGGVAGGVPAKLEAARQAGCAVIVVRRPEEADAAAFETVEALVAAVRR
jgi:precorrin-6A/cobalt-precorrin-6A reductase